MPQRRRLFVIALVCVLLIALLVALSARESSSESSGAVVPTADSTEAQRLSEPAVDLWAGIEEARTHQQILDYATAVEEARIISYIEAVEEAKRREAAAAAAAERKRQEAAAEAARQRAAASQPAPTYASNGSVWDRLAQCESNGNWHINTGNGYYGGLQFNLPTWQAYGGSGYPHENSKAEQIRVAENLRAARGYQPWPACSKKLGLR